MLSTLHPVPTLAVHNLVPLPCSESNTLYNYIIISAGLSDTAESEFQKAHETIQDEVSNAINKTLDDVRRRAICR